MLGVFAFIAFGDQLKAMLSKAPGSTAYSAVLPQKEIFSSSSGL